MVITGEPEGKKVEDFGNSGEGDPISCKAPYHPNNSYYCCCYGDRCCICITFIVFYSSIVKLLFFLDQHQRLLFIGVRIIISFVEIQEQSRPR